MILTVAHLPKTCPPGHANARVPFVSIAQCIPEKQDLKKSSTAIKKKGGMGTIGLFLVKDLEVVYRLEHIHQELACDVVMFAVANPTLNYISIISILWPTWELLVCSILELILYVFPLTCLFII
jgi:hypothetical protein